MAIALHFLKLTAGYFVQAALLLVVICLSVGLIYTVLKILWSAAARALIRTRETLRG